MTTTNLKSGLFLLLLLRQLTLTALVIHIPQMCNTAIFDLTILEPLRHSFTNHFQKYVPAPGEKIIYPRAAQVFFLNKMSLKLILFIIFACA